MCVNLVFFRNDVLYMIKFSSLYADDLHVFKFEKAYKLVCL